MSIDDDDNDLRPKEKCVIEKEKDDEEKKKRRKSSFDILKNFDVHTIFELNPTPLLNVLFACFDIYGRVCEIPRDRDRHRERDRERKGNSQKGSNLINFVFCSCVHILAYTCFSSLSFFVTFCLCLIPARLNNSSLPYPSNQSSPIHGSVLFCSVLSCPASTSPLPLSS